LRGKNYKKKKERNMTKKVEMNYKELCAFFKDEHKPTGKQRQLQFDKWRKEYNIEKIDGKNKYVVSKKDYAVMEQEKRLSKKYNFIDLLAPIVYTTLMNQEDNKVILTKLEQQITFGFVNSSMQFKNLYTSQIAKQINVLPEELSSFKKEVWNINSQTIRNVINKMINLGIITKQKVFKFKDLRTGKWAFATLEYYADVLFKLNEVARKKHNVIFTQLKDVEERNRIKEEVCDYFGFETFFDADLFYLDKKSIEFVYEKQVKPKIAKLLEQDDIKNYLSEINNNNFLKISKSKRKGLKDISTTSMNTMLLNFVRTTPDDLIDNYNNGILDTKNLEIYSKNPRKRKSEKVIDTEGSI
jgi:hypothetical protein